MKTKKPTITKEAFSWLCARVSWMKRQGLVVDYTINKADRTVTIKSLSEGTEIKSLPKSPWYNVVGKNNEK